MNEGDLRDLLASQLEKLEPGLALIKKEQFVPNSKRSPDERSDIRDQLGG
jgi:hypothetical protein